MGSGFVGLAVGASALGLVHGLAPGHGWAVAASYALDKPNRWFYGVASSLILGIGHLVSSIAMVVVYFWAISYFGFTQFEWMNYVAGVVLVALGVWQYFDGHDHTGDGHGSDHAEERRRADDHALGRGHVRDPARGDEKRRGRFVRLRRALPFERDATHSHPHEHADEAADRGLYGMVVFAFALGFTHNEEFDIIAICTGSAYCLELMLLYSVAVITSLVGVTLLLLAGYERYEDRLDAYADYLPAFTATILVAMGVGFILGVF